MRFLLLLCAVCALAGTAWGDDDDAPAGQLAPYRAPQAGAQSYAALFTPEFRVEGNIVGGLIDDPVQRGLNGNAGRISVAEAGIAMRSYVDPYFQFDFEISGGEGFEGETRSSSFGIQAAYATLLRGEWGFWARIGRQPTSFGEYNDSDPDANPFVTAPDVIIQYFGEDDGYIDTGIEVNWNVPIFDSSHIFWLGLLNGDNPVVFHDGVEHKPIYIARYEVFYELGPLTGIEAGLNYIQGLNRRETEIGGSTYVVRGETRFWGLQLKFDFQPEVDYLYSGVKIGGEYFHQDRDYFRNKGLDKQAEAVGLNTSRSESTDGWYLKLFYKFTRNWDTSIRLDHAPERVVDFSADPAASDSAPPAGPGAYTIFGSNTIEATSWALSYHPSRFSTVRGQYTHKTVGNQDWNEVWLQLQVLIGFERPDVF